MIDGEGLTRRIPAVPELARHGDEFLGAAVTVGVVQKAAAPKVLTGEGIGRGDHVPAGPPVRQMIQGGELPCHVEWFVEGGVDGAHQPEPFGDGAERRQHREGVGPPDDVEIVNALAMLAQA